MSRSPLWILVAALLAGCSASAPLTAPPQDASAQPSTATTSRPDIDDAERERLEGLIEARAAADRARFVPADVDFMVGMIGHHAQALVMAELAETRAETPAVRRLAARIDNAQHDEIRTMQRWLAERGQPVPQISIEGTVLTVTLDGEVHDHSGMDHEGMDHGEHGGMHGGMDHAMMPGMLTQAQLDELAAADGLAFDRLFLAYMIQHHGGAVVMVDDLFGTDGAAQGLTTFRLASDIQVDQRTEIARMEQMLDALATD